MTWELRWMEWANGWWSTPVLDEVLPWLTYLGSHFAVVLFIKTPRKPRSVNGDEWWFRIGFRKLPVFREAVKPRLVGGDRSHGATFFTILSWILTKHRKVLRRLVLLYGIQAGVLYGLKYLIQRQRPLFFLKIASKLSKGPGEILDPSFPSGHAVLALMMATLLADRFPQYRVVFFIVAAFIGWTRIYLGLHYPTDVIAGALLGYGVTKLFLLYFPLLPRR